MKRKPFLKSAQFRARTTNSPTQTTPIQKTVVTLSDSCLTITDLFGGSRAIDVLILGLGVFAFGLAILFFPIAIAWGLIAFKTWSINWESVEDFLTIWLGCSAMMGLFFFVWTSVTSSIVVCSFDLAADRITLAFRQPFVPDWERIYSCGEIQSIRFMYHNSRRDSAVLELSLKSARYGESVNVLSIDPLHGDVDRMQPWFEQYFPNQTDEPLELDC